MPRLSTRTLDRRLERLERRGQAESVPPWVTVQPDGRRLAPDGTEYTGQAPVKEYERISPNDWEVPL